MFRRLYKVLAVLVLLCGPAGTQTNGVYVVQQYNFKKRAPGVTLTAAKPATVKLNAAMGGCPRGVNGSDAKHYLYISGGTGAAESVFIAGGSCTSGATSGTIQFTPANTHTGSWTLTSATVGLQETISDLPTSGGSIDLEFTGTQTVRAPLTINKPVRLTIGPGTLVLAAGIVGTVPGIDIDCANKSAVIQRGSSYNNNLLSFDGNSPNTAANIKVKNCTIDGAKTSTAQVQMSGIIFDSVDNIHLDNLHFINFPGQCVGVGGVHNDNTKHPSTNVWLTNSNFDGCNAHGVDINASQHVWILNNTFQNGMHSGVFLGHGDVQDFHVLGNKIHNNGSFAADPGDHFDGHGIFLQAAHLFSETVSMRYGEICNNTIWNNRHQGIAGYGVLSFSVICNNVIFNNGQENAQHGRTDTGLITIDVNAAARTFTRTAGGSGSYITEGFIPGQSVYMTGFTASGGANNVSHAILQTVTATVMTLTADTTGLVDETGAVAPEQIRDFNTSLPWSGIVFDDLFGSPLFNKVNGNLVFDDQSTKTQTWGFRENHGNANTIKANIFDGNRDGTALITGNDSILLINENPASAQFLFRFCGCPVAAGRVSVGNDNFHLGYNTDGSNYGHLQGRRGSGLHFDRTAKAWNFQIDSPTALYLRNNVTGSDFRFRPGDGTDTISDTAVVSNRAGEICTSIRAKAVSRQKIS